MEAKKIILENLKKAVAELNLPDENIPISLQEPKDEGHGDYSTNVAMLLAKTLKKNPLEVAKEIVSSLNTKYVIPNTDRVEAVAPGFINFYLSKEYLMDQLQEATLLRPAQRGSGGQRKIMVEYTDPNPFKEFHVGHLYSNAVGEALCRLLESQGAEVWRANFFGDVGMHTAKAIFGMRKKMRNEKVTLTDLEKRPLQERVTFMGQAYALGATAYEQDENEKEEIKSLNLLIFVAAQQHWQETKGWQPRVDYKKHIEHIDETELAEVKNLWIMGRQWSLDYFEIIYKRLGTKFDGYYPESLTGEWGYDFVLEGLKKGIFEKSDGAIVYRGEKHGFHTRVFINKLGLPTYETKDIGNAPHKYSEFAYDMSLIVTGNEINEYFKVVIAAMKEVNPSLGGKTKHLGHGMVRLPTGKMSSRKGDVITGEWLLDEAKRRIKAQYQEMSEETAEEVAVGAVKYAMLKSSIGRDIAFSFEESISLLGNSGPYLQYTYARTQSVLAKVKSQKSKVKTTIQNAEELALLRAIHRFPEVVAEAAEKFAPSLLCTYLFDLAQKFNLFYQKHPILDSKEKEFRLALTQAVGHILKNGLYLLGIKAPERM